MPYKNKKDQKKAARKHYDKNKDKINQRSIVWKRIRREKNRAYLLQFKMENPCFDCGESNPIVLEFHHLRDKKKNVADVANSNSIGMLKSEVDKCIILCANCHRIRTHIAGGGYGILSDS